MCFARDGAVLGARAHRYRSLVGVINDTKRERDSRSSECPGIVACHWADTGEGCALTPELLRKVKRGETREATREERL